MGVLDKFLDIMRLSDDDDYDDDFYEEEFDDEEETKSSKKGFFSKLKRSENDDGEEEFDETPQNRNFGNKVTPMRPTAKKRNMEVCVIKPSQVDDSREITDTLLNGCTVILNLEGLDLEIAQRLIDFTSGAAYAINGNLQKISNYIFLVTPTNVDISADLQDLLGASFDSSSMGVRY